MVEFILGELGHGKGARKSDLDRPVCVGTQKGHIMCLNWSNAADFTNNPWDRYRHVATIWHHRGIVNINARKRVGKPVEIAFTTDFTIRQNVDSSAFLIMDRG